MFALLLFLQVATQAPDTATYTSLALRRMVAEASVINHRVPPGLGEYAAQLESEISLGFRDGSSGREVTTSVEQVASALTWKRTGEVDQHVTGYRSQSLGPQLATIGLFEDAWAVPSLYGNRLALLFGRNAAPRRRSTGLLRAESARQWAVHPLADDRERIYRFAGGDTIESLTIGDRVINIVRIEVTPRAALPAGTVAFHGELDLDAARKHVVRMRGSFTETKGPPSFGVGAILRSVTALDAGVFVELVNSEVNGEFWLPQYQRFEAQGLAPVLGEGKAIFRILTRFRGIKIVAARADEVAVSGVDSASAPRAVPNDTRRIPYVADTLAARPHLLSFASFDSLARYVKWQAQIGTASATVSSEDFVDVAPIRWRSTGPPILAAQAEHFQDVVHVNRIEGPYTGLGASVRMRDRFPGVIARGNVGYAWSEQTVRGRVSVELARRPWRFAVRGGRSLDPTNDFSNGLDSISTLGALFGVDDHDYVDRWSAGVQASRLFNGDNNLLRLEVGWAQDQSAVQHLAHGLVGHEPFVPNRPVDAGAYVRTALAFEWHRNVQAEFLRPGTGFSLNYLRGDGMLRFQRVEARATTRRNVDAWTFAARVDAGVVTGNIPTQQLFEMGRELNLPGYEYKEFTGTQAATARGLAMYRLGWWRAPLHLYGRVWLPALDPALSVSFQSGWTGATSAADWVAMRRLMPSAVITDGVRSSLSAGIRFFGGALGVAIARPVDHAAAWRVRAEFGQRF